MGQSRKGGGDNDRLAVCDRIHNREAEENCKVGSPCPRGYFDAFGPLPVWSLLHKSVQEIGITAIKASLQRVLWRRPR
jgi:hypothetical protein